MPDYRRFIAYFYEYIDGKKQKNAGFAKVELRNGMWRILFRITADLLPEMPVQVYGFVRENEFLLGLPMGTFRAGKEIVEEWAYEAEHPIGNDRYCFADFAGIWMQSSDDRCFITVWDDEPLELERFVLELPMEETKKIIAEELTEEDIGVEDSLMEMNQDMAEENADIRNGDEIQILDEAEKKTEREESEKFWEFLERRKGFQPFTDEEITDCVQLRPCDIVWLQQNSWQVGRSSFLQHGFYQYRHLLLGRRKDGRWIIGVPGIHNSQEQYMAELFGYHHFKPAKICDCGKKFGYWYRPLTK